MMRTMIGMLITLSLLATNPEFIWQENGIPIRQAANIGWNRASASTPAGDLILAWVDSRDGARQVYAQKVDGSGNTLWDSDGVAVSSATLLSNESPVIASDGSGGAFIAWLGRRAIDSCAFYVQHVDSEGELTWTTNGIPVDQWHVSNVKTRYSIKLVAENSDTAFLFWFSSGNPIPGVFGAVLNESGVQTSAQITSMENGYTGDFDVTSIDSGAVIVWEFDEDYNHSQILAQRLDMQLASLWDSNGVVVCDSISIQMGVSIADAGSNRVAIGWQDARNGNGFQIYSQLLDENGDPEWLINGVPVSDSQGPHEHYQMISDLSNHIYFVWEGGVDVFGQCLDYSGARQWNSGGLIIASGQPSYYKLPQISPNGTNGVFVVWPGRLIDSSISRIYCQYVTEAGDISFQGNGLPLSENQSYTYFPNVVTDENGGCVVAWLEDDSTGSAIKSQHVTTSGSTLWDNGGISLFAGINVDANSIQVLPWGNDELLIVWNDTRGYGGSSALYAQSINLSGDQNFETNGKYLRRTHYSQDWDIISDGNSGAFIGFQRDENLTRNLFAQHIDQTLEPTWPSTGVPVWDQNLIDQTTPILAANANSELYYAWAELRSFFDFDIFIQKFNANGSPQWLAGGVSIAPNEPGGENYPKEAVVMADSGVVIIWQASPTFDDINLYASKVLPDGNIAWRRTISDAPRNQGNPQIVYDSTLDLLYVAWEDSYNGNGDLYLRSCDSDGNLSDELIISATVNEETGLSLAIADDGSGAVWAGWIEATEDSLSNSPGNVYVRNMSALSDPIQIANTQFFKNDLCIQAVSTDRILAVWSEFVNYDPTGKALYFYDSQGEGEYGQLNGKILCDVFFDQSKAQIAPLPGNSPESMKYGIAWLDARGSFFGGEGFSTYNNIYAQLYADPSVGIAQDIPLPQEFYINPAYPNPFNGSVTVTFNQPSKDVASIRIYDLLGRRVYQTTNQTAGHNRFNWNGQDKNGLALESGIYFLQVQFAGQTFSQKVTYLK